MTTLHVAVAGSDRADGSEEHPFATIGKAAALAQPGDTVLVHAGEYRERVKPPRGGLSDTRRITYAAAPGEHVVIKGSEQVTGWQPGQGTVWKVSIPNTLFGDFNPYTEEVDGDWIVYPTPTTPHKHLGEVYLNGKSLYEVHSLDALNEPRARTQMIDDWTGATVEVRDPEQTRFVWYSEVTDLETTIWANFQGADPNEELVEINVRRSVFYPTEHHIDYITVRGFELAQAASPWTPPTADQPGLIRDDIGEGCDLAVVDQRIDLSVHFSKPAQPRIIQPAENLDFILILRIQTDGLRHIRPSYQITLSTGRYSLWPIRA